VCVVRQGKRLLSRPLWNAEVSYGPGSPTADDSMGALCVPCRPKKAVSVFLSIRVFVTGWGGADILLVLVEPAPDFPMTDERCHLSGPHARRARRSVKRSTRRAVLHMFCWYGVSQQLSSVSYCALSLRDLAKGYWSFRQLLNVERELQLMINALMLSAAS